MDLVTKLKNIPLDWVKDATHYFTNTFREYWIATIQDDTLLTSGLDILKGYMFGYSEIFWILLFINFSYDIMTVTKKVKDLHSA